MAGVNKVILLGNLGADPEMRTLPSGSKVASFNIATSESYTNKDGQRVEQTEWHRIELWDNLATIAEKFLKKGSVVFLEGKIRTEEWVDKEGTNRKGIKIRATNLTLLGGNNKNLEDQVPNYPRPLSATSTPPSSEMIGAEEEDILPF